MKKGFAAIVIPYIAVISVLLGGTYGGSRLVTAMAMQEGIEREHTIVIDPGHGGVDGGATSCTGVLESNLNLEISLRLNDLFHFLGFQTLMIRTTDISVYTEGESIAQKKISDLRHRVKMVNEAENALLLSIHQNQFQESRYSGAQVFHNGRGDSQALAQTLQNALRNVMMPASKRQEKRAEGIYLMEHVECCALLIECGFLSNPEEEAKLRSPEYQKKLCAVIASVICNSLSKSNT